LRRRQRRCAQPAAQALQQNGPHLNTPDRGARAAAVSRLLVRSGRAEAPKSGRYAGQLTGDTRGRRRANLWKQIQPGAAQACPYTECANRTFI
jgi:hypothetical protein